MYDESTKLANSTVGSPTSSPVDEQLLGLNAEMGVLAERLSVLADRLNVILSPVPNLEQGQKAADNLVRGGSDMVNRLVQLNDRAFSLELTIRSLTDRVEL